MGTNPSFEKEMAEILDSFIVETNEIIEKLGRDLLTLEKEPKNSDLHNVIFRAVHTVKGTSSFLGFDQMTELSHKWEDVLNKIRKGDLVVTSVMMDVIFEAYDLLKALLQRVEQRLSDPIDLGTVIERLSAIAAGANVPASTPHVTPPSPAVPEAPAAASAQPTLAATEPNVPAAEEQDTPEGPENGVDAGPAASVPQSGSSAGAASQPTAPGKSVDTTIRVDVTRLDVLMDLVGELVLGRNRLTQLAQQISEKFDTLSLARELNETNSHIDFITTELQMAVMKTRMVPIAKLFNKIPRMVRELTKELRKDIGFEIVGEETELDKSLIEEMNDPLVHLIRNAAGHGIEMPEERIAAGKKPRGTITVRADHEGNNIVISVQDDGRGMDPEVLKKKAVEKGLITEQEAAELDSRDALHLVFLPGFSTATMVTNVSGRGVGMDVVRTNVEKLKGMIDIDSVPGQGSRFVIRLPLTLAILQALLVESGNEIFSIPLDSVVEVVRIRREEVESINGKDVIRLRETVLPLGHLSDVLGGNPSDDTSRWIYIVVVGLGAQRLGLAVDRLMGQKEVVIKSIGEYLGAVRGIAGSTILGDGRVIMIVDVSELMKLYAGRTLRAAETDQQ